MEFLTVADFDIGASATARLRRLTRSVGRFSVSKSLPDQADSDELVNISIATVMPWNGQSFHPWPSDGKSSALITRSDRRLCRSC